MREVDLVVAGRQYLRVNINKNLGLPIRLPGLGWVLLRLVLHTLHVRLT